MARNTKDTINAMGFEVLESGESIQVVISKRAKKEFDGLETQQKARLDAVIKRWCSGKALTEEMMKVNEGRTPKHKEMIQAFKAFKVRLYGFDRTVHGTRTFFIVDTDPAKKQTRAGPVLNRAKTRADAALDELSRKEKE